ncbi:hypothetical protein JCM21900_002749 [Sporobolomyces salmonicolor]
MSTTNNSTGSGDVVANDLGTRSKDPSVSSAPSAPSSSAATSTAAPSSASTAAHSEPAPSNGYFSAVGDEFYHRTRGFFNAVHGAGEALRGTINSALDGIGDGVAAREKGSVASREGSEGKTADKGVNEYKGGVSDLLGGGANKS